MELSIEISRFISKLLALHSIVSSHIAGTGLDPPLLSPYVIVHTCEKWVSNTIKGLLERGGVSVAKLPEEVKVYLVTASSAPYCMYHSLVEFHLQQRRSLVTNLEITFRSSNSTASVKITIPKQQQLGKGVLAHPVPLCQIKVVMLKYLPKLQIWKKDKAVIVGNFCTTALPVGNREKIFCLSQHLSLTASRPLEHDLVVPCA
ncbi:Phospholipase A1 member A [Chelonia mydas]|uniref:Phospholipase A1 member A n=1 Tax=Chelonia mydas TaxID=8469 RepID=M7B923_CHEMY|nr:Phospholipase A1 member A [Chelonia mydas]